MPTVTFWVRPAPFVRSTPPDTRAVTAACRASETPGRRRLAERRQRNLHPARTDTLRLIPQSIDWHPITRRHEWPHRNVAAALAVFPSEASS